MTKEKNKKRVSVYVDAEKWDNLGKVITCSRSQWINEQMEKQLTIADDVELIELRIDALKKEVKKYTADISILESDKQRILQIREENSREFERINEAMNTVRRIVNSNRDAGTPEGYIEKIRVQFIANNHTITLNALEEQIRKENLLIKDLPLKNDETVINTHSGSL